MPQIRSSLRLLFSSSPLKLKPPSLSILCKPSFSVSKRHRIGHPRPSLLRSSGSLAETEGRDKEAAMDGTEGGGFNRSRAEGRDGSDRPRKTLKLRERRTLNPASSISYVQILGTGMDTQDTLPSVLLFFDKQRFIFNAGEGLQRFCTEHKVKLSKIDHIFLSRICSETTGGIPGLLLTLAGMGDEGMSVNLWGSSNLKYFVNAMRSFIPNAAMVHARSFGPEPSSNAVPDPITFAEPIILIDDEVVKISALLLQPKSSSGYPISNEGSFVESSGLKERNDQFSQSTFSSDNTSSVVKPGDMSVIYVCELSEVKGTFHPERAKALGLRPGPKYRELQIGKSVKSDSQDIMVHPSDVMDPSLPGPIVVLVDCPSDSYVQELLYTQSLKPYYVDSLGNPVEGAKYVTCVIHLSPTSIISSPDYQNWMTRFGSAQHIMAGHQMKNVEVPVLNSSARIATRLNYLCPQLFPFPGYWSLQDLNYVVPESTTSTEALDSKLCKIISAENLLKFNLRPYAQLGLDRTCVPSLMTPSEITNELLSEIPEIVDAARHVNQFWHESGKGDKDMTSMEYNNAVMEEPWLNENSLPSCLEGIRRDDMEIVLLGTGSSEPSKYRNVSSIYINLFTKGGILLDCGEGALGQLKRRYGVKDADDVVRGLKCIWISHIHADHHAGITRILALRRDLLKGVPHEPLLVVGPGQLKRFLHGYQDLEDLDMQFLDCRHTMIIDAPPGNPNNTLDSTLFARGAPMQSYWKKSGSSVDNGIAVSVLTSLRNVLSEAGIEALVSFPVVHCPQAYGVVLQALERTNSGGKVIPGWKLVYSGDTRPCPALIEAARGATVLIHEATFEDGMMQEAVARNHSTTKEAIEVGGAAGAYRIVLTHFSQRYPKIPVIDEEAHMQRTCIAFDMMSINVADLRVIPRILPYIKLLFRNEMIVDECDDIAPTHCA